MQLVDINIGLHGFSGWNDSIGPETEDTTNMFLLNADWIQNLIKAEQSRGRPELSR